MSLGLQGLGKELYPKTTLELGIEKSIADSQAKLAVLSSLDKVEVEVKEEKRFGIKRRRVEVKNYDDFIKSLDSSAKLNNQILTPEEVAYALKDLEKEAEGSLREKIRAVRKEVEEREGISKRRRNSLILLGILGTGFALGGLAWYLNQDHKPPEIKKVDYKDRVNKGEEQEVSIKVFEENPGEAYLRFNSSSIQIPLVNKFDNGTAIYKASFNPANILAREGLFSAELVVKDKAGNEAKQSLSFLANLQPPVFKDLKLEKVDLGKYKVSLSLEEDNLKEAYVLVGDRKIPLTKYGDKLFGEVDLNCNKDFEVKAEDVFGLSSSLKGEALLSEADKLELGLFCSSELFRKIYENDKALASSILTVARNNGSAIPKNLAYLILDQIWRDYRVDDKLSLAREVLPLYLDFGKEVQRMSEIYALNNASLYFGSERLKSEIGKETISASLKMLRENDGINRDFDNARKHYILLKLSKHVQNILKYPKEWKEGSIQVDDVGYKTGLAAQDESEFWYVSERAIKFIIDKLDRGEAEYELGIPDSRLEAWYRRVRLFPRELFYIDIVSGKENIEDGRIVLSLDFGKRNVTPDERIGGKIPQEWLEEMAKRDFKEKNLRYQLAMMKDVGRNAAISTSYWPISYREFGKAFDIVTNEDPVALYIIGYSRALGSRYIPWGLEPVIPMEGQITPYYAVLIARTFGRAALVISNNYPDYGTHDEPYIPIPFSVFNKINQYGESLVPYTFGAWQYKQALIEDHRNYGRNPPNPRIIKPDGTEENISI